MTMTLDSGGVVYSSNSTNHTQPYLTSLLTPHSLIMSTKTQQSNGTNHNRIPPSLPSPPLPIESRTNDLKQDTSGEETAEADTTETESKYSSEEEEEEELEDEVCPPEDCVEMVEGYEMVSFETVVVPPPPPSDRDREDKQREAEKSTCYTETQVVVKITEEQARTYLLEHVSSHMCYGREAARQMVITGMEYVPALHYELQTFTERRETCWSYAPHRPDTKLDLHTPERPESSAPLPWQIEETPGRMFRDEVRLVTVPNTGVIKTCHKCRGTGGMTCGECGGKGWVRCLHCHGDVHLPEGGGGSLDRDRCYYCQHSKHGHGHLECSKCKARGKVNCSTCEGSTNILCFIQLSITWRINTSEHITEKLDIPDDLIRDVSGQVAFEEEKLMVGSVETVEDDLIKMASAQLVASHASKFPEEKILRQRHQVRVVPVTKVNYEWKGKTRSFFVYGYENKVHLPNNSYPQSCCWGCNLM